MRYDVRESADGMWEVVDLKTGQVATLGTLRLERLQHVEAMAAVDMLQSRFQQAARDRQNATDQQERTPFFGIRSKDRYGVRLRTWLPKLSGFWLKE